MVTIRDVAKAAGVSHKTVSRVVNREPNVTEATRQRVETMIEALNYVPNQGARLMRNSRSGVIGVITDVVSTSPNSTEILHGIQDFVSNTPYSVLIANTGGDPANEGKIWRTFRQHRIDGVLYITMFHRAATPAVDLDGLPLVLVNCFSDEKPALPAVVPDDYQGGSNAARLAIDKGHRRIAFLTLNPAIEAARLRWKAFEEALAAAQIEIDDALIAPGYEGPVGEEHLVAYDRARALFSLPEAVRPSALLCGNDEIAMQAICAAAALGLRVPEDIAIIGFDDFRLISNSIVPALTTVALPYYAIGMRATERLLNIIDGGADSGAIERIECPAVERQSA